MNYLRLLGTLVLVIVPSMILPCFCTDVFITPDVEMAYDDVNILLEQGIEENNLGIRFDNSFYKSNVNLAYSLWMKNRAAGRTSKTLVTALNKVASFRSIDKGESCNTEQVDILWEIDAATRRNSRQSNTASTRLEKLANYYFVKHATDCQKVYLKMFRKTHKGMGKDTLSALEPMLTNALGTEDADKRELEKKVVQMTSIDDITLSKLYEHIKEKCIASRTHDYVDIKTGAFDDDKFENVVKQHLILPCKYYYDVLHIIFEPIEFSAIIIWPFGGDELSSDLIKGWTNYKLCKMIFKGVKNFQARLKQEALKH